MGNSNPLEKRILEGHTGSRVNSVSFSPDGRLLVSGGDDKTIRLWDVKVGKELPVSPLQGHFNGVVSAVFSRDGKFVASGSNDHFVRLWDAQTGKELAFSPLKAHEAPILAVAFHPDGKVLISVGREAIRRWDIESGKELAGIDLGNLGADFMFPMTCGFSPDRRTIALAFEHANVVRLLDIETGSEMSVSPFVGHEGRVWAVAFTPDGNTLATGSADRTIRFLDVKTGKELAVSPLKGHSDTVYAIAFSPTGNIAASGSSDQLIRLWNAETGDEYPSSPLEEGGMKVESVAFSPDGKFLASAGWSYPPTIQLWSIV